MGREIDERVVQMKFENGQFEKGISTSIRSMEELKKGMNFDDAVKGFNKLDEAAKGMKLQGLASGVEAVRIKFDLLQITAFNVLNRISNKAIDTGERLVKGLSIDQVAVGWSKFADKTGSVQTIMSATAKQFTDTREQMAYVNEQLDKLNWFTDETSYNFVDMVNNIGKFTSNNIALDDSVTAMQGIANWAAISGANANEASRAMYNISQALSSGAVRLEDWMSIENANMGTAAFKELAIQMAVTAGTLKKQGDKIVTINKGVEVSVENFRNTLTEDKWLNKDVLMATLNQYGQATDKLNRYIQELWDSGSDLLTSDLVTGLDAYLSGAKTAQEISDEWGLSLEKTTTILEDFNNETDRFGLKAFQAAQEAKTFEDAINSVKDAVSTGWMKSFEYIFGDYLEAKEFYTDLANALYDIFAAGGEKRNAVLAQWKEWEGRDRLIDSIWNALAAIMAILKPIQTAWNNIFGEMTAVRLLLITARFQKLMDTLSTMALNNIPKLERIFSGLFAILDMLRMLLGGAFKIALSVIQEIFGGLNVDVFEFTASIGDSIVALRDWMREGHRFDLFVIDIIKILQKAIAQVRSFINAIKEFGPVKAVINAFNGIFTENFHGIDSVIQFTLGLLSSLWNLIKSVPQMTSLEKVKELFDNFKISVANNLFDIGISFEGLGKLGETIFGGLIDLLQTVTGGFGSAGKAAGGAIGVLTDQLNKVDWAAVTILATGVAMLALAFKIADSVAIIAKSFGKVTDVMKSFKGMTDSISNYFKALKENIQSNNILKIAAAIGILALAFWKLAQLDSAALLTASGALAIVTAAIIALMVAMDKTSKGKDGGGEKSAHKLATTVMAFAAAVYLIAKALNSINLESIVPRLAVLGVVMVAMLGLVTYFNSGKAVSKSIPGVMSYISMAAAIYLLIGALKMISLFSAEDLFKALPVMAGLMVVMAVCARIATRTVQVNKSLTSAGFKAGGSFSRNSSGQKAVGGFGSIIAMALAMTLLCRVIKKLGEMDPETLVKGLVAMGAVFTEFGVLMLTTKAAGQYAKDAGKMLLYVSIALNLLGPALKSLGNLDEATALKGLVIVGILELLMKSLIKASKDAGENAAKAGLMLIAMAGALMAIQLMVKTLGRLDLGTLAKGTAAVSAIILSIGAMMKGAGGSFSMETTKSLVRLTVIIGILSAVLIALSFMDPKSVLASAGALSSVLLSLGASFKLMNKVEIPSLKDMGKLYASVALLGAAIGLIAHFTDPKSVLATATAMSEVLIALGVSMRIMSGTKQPTQKQAESWSQMVKSIGKIMIALAATVAIINLVGGSVNGILQVTTGMSEILISLALAGRIMDKSKNPSVNNTRAMNEWVVSVGVLMVALGAVVGAINSTGGSVDGVLKLTTGMSEIIIALGLASRIMGQNGGDFKIDKGAMAGLVVGIGAIAAIIAIFSRMANSERVIPLASGLSLVVIALAGVMKILSTINGDISGVNVGMFALMTIIVGLLGSIVAGLSNITDPARVLPIATGLSLLALTLTGVVAVLSVIPEPSLAAGLKAIALMIAVIAAMTGVVTGLGALMQLQGFEQLMTDGGTAFQLLGKAIGGFAGGIIGGFAAGVMSGLPDIGTYLSKFMENAQYFFDSSANIPDNLGDKIGSLALAMIALGAADFATALLNFLSGPFGTQSDIVDKFENFGNALAAFSEAIGDDFDADTVQSAANAGKTLAALEASLPRQDGLIQKFLGKKDLKDFGNRLKSFGKAIVKFSDTVAGHVDADAVTAAANAGKLLADLEESLPAQGGKLQEWLGEKDIAQFGRQLKSFGKNLVEFSGIVAGKVDEDAVTSAKNAGSMLAELENSLSSKGGMLQEFLGEKSLATFGDNLNDLGTGLVDFSDDAKTVSIESITNATGALKELVDLESHVTSTGGWGEIFTGESNFGSFGENLSQLGEGLKSYNTSISAILIDRIQDVTVELDKIITLAKNTDSTFTGIKTIGESITAFAPSIGVWSSNASTADTEKMATVTAEIEKLLKLSELTTASQWISDITTHAASMISSLVNTIQSKEQRLCILGKDVAYWIVKGFESGELSYEYIASAAASKLAQKIQDSVETTLGIASPSTVMIEEGHWVVKGLAEGITSDMSAEDAAEKKASNIVAAFQAGLDKLDLLAQNRQLKYDVWSVNEGLGATDYEKQQYELQLKQGELEDAAANVQAQNAAFEVAKQSFAEGSKQYIEAENRMLEAIKKMYEIRNEISQMQSEMFASGGDSIRRNNDAYIAYIKENEEAYKMLGMSEEQLIEDAKKKTGFGIETSEFTSDKIDTQEIIDKALGQQQVDIVQEQVRQRVSKAVSGGMSQGLTDPSISESTGNALAQTMNNVVDQTGKLFNGTGLSKLDSVLYDGGSTASGNFTDGFTNSFKSRIGESYTSSFNFAKEAIAGAKAAGDVNSPSKVMFAVGTDYGKGLINGLNNMSSTLNSTGTSIGANTINGLISGINAKAPSAIAAAKAVADAVSAQMRRALQINSPSKLTRSFGNYLDEGLALGMRERIPDVTNATYDVSNAMASAFDDTKYLINSILESDDDFSPVITPVLNFDEIKAQGRQIGRILPRQGIDLQSTRLKVGSIADQAVYGQNGTKGPTIQTNYKFTQNNYSPKALNRSEIYRQTNNQFSRLKGASQR